MVIKLDGETLSNEASPAEASGLMTLSCFLNEPPTGLTEFDTKISERATLYKRMKNFQFYVHIDQWPCFLSNV